MTDYTILQNKGAGYLYNPFFMCCQSCPVLNGREVYQLSPASYPIQGVTDSGRFRMNFSLESGRKLLGKYNKGIKEYFFEKNIANYLQVSKKCLPLHRF